MIKHQFLVVCLLILINDLALAQVLDTQGSPQVRFRDRNVYKTRISPQWLDGNCRFWYRNELSGGKREYILVDAVEGERKPAFDHDRLAKALIGAGGNNVAADRLPFDALQFDAKLERLTFRLRGQFWSCDLETYEVAQIEKELPLNEARRPNNRPRASTRTGAETELRFVNQTDGTVELFWLDSGGDRQSYGKLAAGAEKRQHTYAGHVWLITNAAGNPVAEFVAAERPSHAVIDKSPIRRRPERRVPRTESGTSPDGKWRSFVRDGNVFVVENDREGDSQLTEDGSPDTPYQMLQWSPDSQTLIAFRMEPGEEKNVYLIESSPRGGGRAVLHQRPYALPGDKFTSYELKLFRRTSAETETTTPASRWHAVKTNVESVDFGQPRIRWNQDGRRFSYTKIDRGHQQYRVIEVDCQTGQSRNILDEQTDTFIWTAHTENLGIRTVSWLENSNELIYVSEVDGWRHLYLIDPTKSSDADNNPQVTNGGKRLFAPGLKNQITQGEFVVRGVDRIDEDRRQIWFRASGLDSKQDPYHIHYCRVNFDGTGFVKLTEGNGTHAVQFSPDWRYLIDTYSRVDMPPVHELRCAEDGDLVCQLEAANVAELKDSGWKPPEVFSAKGRDGKTEIWGIICRPRDFDPNRKYPVIEAIYAGPHDSHVPKSFSSRSPYSSLIRLGFIVVKIDGMGTANRSKAFHDVCWHNLKDAGFPDRILWMKAAAAKHPEIDLSRVGIYGGSAGGQNAAAAVLFHNDFYQAAVAGCGCHDNRMDKASWNEQWMGYPAGEQYSACSNIDNAHRLKGRLMLIVGEMDRNVPPESTMRFADALIKADKNFDLLVIPGAGHGMGGAYGERRMHEFFVRHLIEAPANP